MTKLRIVDAPRFVTFGQLEPGELFTNEEGEGLFIKNGKMDKDNEYGNAIVVVPSGPEHEGFVQAGDRTSWSNPGEVRRVIGLVATTSN